MKIIYLANIRLPTEKAHGYQIAKMCEAFASLGNEVELVVPRRFNSIKEEAFSYYGVPNNFKITKIPCVDFIFLNSTLGGFSFWLESVTFLICAKIYLLFKKFDFIYTRDLMAGRFFGNSALELHSLPELIKPADFKILNKAKKIFALTSFIKNDLVKAGIVEEKIAVSPDAVDLSQFDGSLNLIDLREKLNLPKDKKIITYAGKFKTMGQGKGVEDIVKIFPEILKSYNGAFFLLAGVNQDEVKEITEIFNQLGVDSANYKIVAHIPQKELFEYMQSSDVLVMNYPNTKHYACYMSPLKLFEYMASKRPIVSSDLPAIREVLNETNAVLVRADDSQSLKDGILSVLRDEKTAVKISEQAFKDVQNYTWKKRAEKILEFVKA